MAPSASTANSTNLTFDLSLAPHASHGNDGRMRSIDFAVWHFGQFKFDIMVLRSDDIGDIAGGFARLITNWFQHDLTHLRNSC